MCFAKIAIAGPDETIEYSEKLILLLGIDTIVIDNNNPTVASPNQFDFIFLAKEEIDVTGIYLYFLFPFKTNPMPMKNVRLSRTSISERVSWVEKYLRISFNTRKENEPSSFGYNEEPLNKLIGNTSSKNFGLAVINIFRESIHKGKIGLRESHSIEIGRYHLKGTPSEFQHHKAALKGVLKKNEIFHIRFHADQAFANIGDEPCSGNAWLFYYNSLVENLSSAYTDSPWSKFSTVP